MIMWLVAILFSQQLYTPADESIVTADLCHEVDLREKVLVSGSDELLTSAKNKLARFDQQQQPIITLCSDLSFLHHPDSQRCSHLQSPAMDASSPPKLTHHPSLAAWRMLGLWLSKSPSVKHCATFLSFSHLEGWQHHFPPARLAEPFWWLWCVSGGHTRRVVSVCTRDLEDDFIMIDEIPLATSISLGKTV